MGPLFFLFMLTVLGLLRPGYSAISQAGSDLGVGPNAWMLNISFFITGLLVIAFAIGFFVEVRQMLGKRRRLIITHGKDAIEQLATIAIRPADIDLLICTHYDDDHAGNLAAFPNARLIAQRQQHEVARAGDPRFASTRSQWDQPAARYQLVDGDTELLPGLELIETSGHTPGHQAVLVHLPQTGPVLLAIDAVAVRAHFTADRAAGPTDANGAEAIASTRKLLELVERKHVSLVIFGHDGPQWSTLKHFPDFFD